MEVREIMTSDPGLCRLDQTLKEAAEMMLDCDCGAIPVVESLYTKRLVGIITDRDIAVRAVAKGLDPNTTRVADCMSVDITHVRPDSNVEEVERIMENLQVRRVPVVDNDDVVCGMVSMADIALTRPIGNAAQLVQELSKPVTSEDHPAYLS